jgi:Glutamine amidotransferase domain
MCKVVVFTNFSKVKDQDKATEAIGNILLKIERDGFGYAIQGSKGAYGERVACSSGFSSRFGVSSSKIVRLPIVEPRYNSFGEKTRATGPAIFHGRTSTNSKALVNVHPMQADGWNLIHNGVVTDHGPKYIKATQNDSEDVLHRLKQGIGEVEKHLSGYYAFAAIDPHGRLHLCRDTEATLYIAWIDSLDSYLITTTESLLESTCKALKVRPGPIEKVADNSYAIFELNNVAYSQWIKPRGYGREEAGLASLSLGRELQTSSAWDLIGSEESYRFNDSTMTDLEQVDIEALITEMESLDDSYTIQTEDGLIIASEDYYRLDPISQDACTITREDGSILPPLYSSEKGRIA